MAAHQAGIVHAAAWVQDLATLPCQETKLFKFVEKHSLNSKSRQKWHGLAREPGLQQNRRISTPPPTPTPNCFGNSTPVW